MKTQTEEINEEVVSLLNLLCDSELSSESAITNIIKLVELSSVTNNPLHKAWGHFYNGAILNIQANYNQALHEVKLAMQLFSIGDSKSGTARALDLIGLVYANRGDYLEALENHIGAIDAFVKLGDESGRAKAISHCGRIYSLQGYYPKALEQCLLALKIYEKLGVSVEIIGAKTNVGTVYHEMGNYNEALRYYLETCKLAKEAGDFRLTAIIYCNLGTVYKDIDLYENALQYYTQAMQIFNENGNIAEVASVHLNRGGLYLKMDNYDETLKEFNTALKIFEEVGDKDGQASIHANLGSLFTYTKEYQRAETHLNKSLTMARELSIRVKEMLCLEFFYQLRKDEGKWHEALMYHEQYIAAEKELESKETSQTIANMQFGYQIEKKEQEVKFERERKEYLEKAYNLLEKEKHRSENLLLNILPSEVAEELKQKGNADAKLFNDVTVFFSDFKSFTTISEKLTPQELVNELHECFSAFDNIIHKYGIEKIKTVGDAYLCVAGLPTPNPNHAEDMIKAAIEIQNFIATRVSKAPLRGLGAVRIGINSGSVVAGIVGVKKFAYDIWGDTVNIAARMEQNGEAGKVNISEATYELVKDKFTCEYRGEIEAKNKGKLKMYFAFSNPG